MVALCVMYGIAPAWGGNMYSRPARLRLRAVAPPKGSRSARHCFRDLLMTLDRLCRYPLPSAFRAENAAFALRAPTMPHAHAAGGRRFMARCVRASGGQGYFQHNSPGLSWGAAAEAQVENLLRGCRLGVKLGRID